MGVEPTHLFGGVAGGLVRALLHPNKSIISTASTGLVGALCAMYATPLCTYWMAIVDPSAANAVAFGVGLVGMSMAEGVVSMANTWSKRPRLPRGATWADMSDAMNPDAPYVPPPVTLPACDPIELQNAPVEENPPDWQDQQNA